jgi:glycosyltransferase involved in cell wall biosynthesis
VFYGYYGTLTTRFFVWLERLVARFTHCIIALTQSDLEDHLRFGIAPRERFRVIHSGIDFSTFADASGIDPASVRRGLGIAPESVVIGTLGRLTAIKGQRDLVTAFAGVCDHVANAWLLLVGDGDERSILESLARELGVEERVVFAGWRDDIVEVLGAMDVFAFPSINEGMGKALVEAMFSGLPCVATDVGGIPELIRHEREGLLVAAAAPGELRQALVRLVSDREESARFAGAARERAQNYSVEAMIEQLELLYHELGEAKVA